MKRKIGLVTGCSHSAGSEIDGNDDSTYNRDNSFGSVFVKKLGYEPLNISLSGSANSGIARGIIRWFETEYDSDTMDVFVCIGWTESSRLEVPNRSDYREGNSAVPWYDISANSFWRVNFGWEGGNNFEREVIPKYHQFMAENPLILENWAATNILMIQYLLKSLNIPYIMCNTMHMFQKGEHVTKYLVDAIDQSKYYNLLSTQDEAFYWKYRHMGYINEKAKYWHHGLEPHKLFAEELYNFAKENKCLDL